MSLSLSAIVIALARAQKDGSRVSSPLIRREKTYIQRQSSSATESHNDSGNTDGRDATNDFPMAPSRLFSLSDVPQ